MSEIVAARRLLAEVVAGGRGVRAGEPGGHRVQALAVNVAAHVANLGPGGAQVRNETSQKKTSGSKILLHIDLIKRLREKYTEK